MKVINAEAGDSYEERRVHASLAIGGFLPQQLLLVDLRHHPSGPLHLST